MSTFGDFEVIRKVDQSAAATWKTKICVDSFLPSKRYLASMSTVAQLRHKAVEYFGFKAVLDVKLFASANSCVKMAKADILSRKDI